MDENKKVVYQLMLTVDIKAPRKNKDAIPC